jgi:hypothetical protein
VTGRDYIGEMDKRIADATAGPAWAAPVVAAELHAALLADDPDLLDGWLHAIAQEALRQAITNRSRAVRTAARHHAAPHAFAVAAEAGDTDALLGMFAVDYVVAPDRTRKRAGDMTGADHAYVADRYADTGNTALLLAEFHRAVGKKVGTRRTADVFTAEQYDEMYRSIMGRAA